MKLEEMLAQHETELPIERVAAEKAEKEAEFTENETVQETIEQITPSETNSESQAAVNEPLVINSTYDYDCFSFINGNRKIIACNYTKLERSMLEKQLIIPICVNDKMQIIDGQHRFSVAKSNQLPVYYYIVKDYTIEEVKRANMVSRNWTKKDFLELQIENEQPDYLLFSYLSDNYNIAIQDLIKIFAAVQGIKPTLLAKHFEEGTFTTEGVEKVEEFLMSLEDFSSFRYYTTKPFVAAFMKLYFHEKYSHKRMLERLRTRAGSLTKKITTDDYVVHLTRDIYSFGVVRNPLYYDSVTKRFYN